ncbi:MAG: type II 3-dehydroquinate dehydratase [Clostridia bacterium]|nr:type II 3-dehydroquinate dehydratase [Clostridia bacterium]
MDDNPPRLLLLNGPNLNMLGRRDKSQYGSFTLSDAESAARETAKELGYGLDAFQSNHEGALVEAIQQAMGVYSGIVINAGAFTHYSYALHDAIELCGLPVVEVHISDIHRREAWRHVSVILPACIGQIAGLGLDSYTEGVRRVCARIAETEQGRETL